MNHSLNRSTFAILFYTVKLKLNSKGEIPIYCRLTVDGKKKEFSTQIWITETQWDPKSAKIKGNKEFARTANNALDSIRNKLHGIRADLLTLNRKVTAEAVMKQYSGKGEKYHTLIDIHTYFNEHHIKRLIGKGYAAGTYKRYVISLSHLKDFLKTQYKITDIALNDLTYL